MYTVEETGRDAGHDAVKNASDNRRVAEHITSRVTHDGKGRRALFWSAGGTVLSAVGFVALALFEQYNSCLTELRGDLKHFNEISADLVKKESMRRCYDTVKECKQELHAVRTTRTDLDKESALYRKDREELLRELQKLRERLAAVEGRQAATPVVFPVFQPAKPVTPSSYTTRGETSSPE